MIGGWGSISIGTIGLLANHSVRPTTRNVQGWKRVLETGCYKRNSFRELSIWFLPAKHDGINGFKEELMICGRNHLPKIGDSPRNCYLVVKTKHATAYLKLANNNKPSARKSLGLIIPFWKTRSCSEIQQHWTSTDFGVRNAAAHPAVAKTLRAGPPTLVLERLQEKPMGGGSFWLSKQVISKVLSGYNLLGWTWTTEPPSSEQWNVSLHGHHLIALKFDHCHPDASIITNLRFKSSWSILLASEMANKYALGYST